MSVTDKHTSAKRSSVIVG